MGSEWNVKHEPDMEKLQHNVDEWQEEADDALATEGEYGRRYQNAMYLLRILERRLEAAQRQIERHELDEKRTAKEIVDDLMRS